MAKFLKFSKTLPAETTLKSAMEGYGRFLKSQMPPPDRRHRRVITVMDDPFRLLRFIKAQETDYETALGELRRGKKRSHWIWYIFPQVDGLGHSPMAEAYAVKSRGEAEAYLAHPLLGARLRECAGLLLPHAGLDIAEIMDFPDDVKLRSSMTLFAALSEPGGIFHHVLEAFFRGETDPRTLDFLEKHP